MKGMGQQVMVSAAERRSEPPAEPGCPGLLGQTRPVLRASFCPFAFPSGHSYLERLLNVEVPQKVR